MLQCSAARSRHSQPLLTGAKRLPKRAAHLRLIVAGIVIEPGDAIWLEGNLGAMLQVAAGKPLPIAVNSDVNLLVAGGGFEPPTFGL
jgi:hypothetical protein